MHGIDDEFRIAKIHRSSAHVYDVVVRWGMRGLSHHIWRGVGGTDVTELYRNLRCHRVTCEVSVNDLRFLKPIYARPEEIFWISASPALSSISFRLYGLIYQEG